MDTLMSPWLAGERQGLDLVPKFSTVLLSKSCKIACLLHVRPCAAAAGSMYVPTGCNTWAESLLPAEFLLRWRSCWGAVGY